jgi:hypothetical protein
MAQSVQSPEPLRATTPTEPTTTRLRTVTGSRWPRKCACGCGLQIPRDPEVRYVVDFGAPKPYPAYLREHSHSWGQTLIAAKMGSEHVDLRASADS